MSARKPKTSKFGKEKTSTMMNDQDDKTEQLVSSRKRVVTDRTTLNDNEPVSKKSKHNLIKSNIKIATDAQIRFDKNKLISAEKYSKVKVDNKSNSVQHTSSSESDDSDDEEDDSEYELDIKTLSKSDASKQNNENSEDDDAESSDDDSSDDDDDEVLLNELNVSKQTNENKLKETRVDNDDEEEEDSSDDDSSNDGDDDDDVTEKVFSKLNNSKQPNETKLKETSVVDDENLSDDDSSGDDDDEVNEKMLNKLNASKKTNENKLKKSSVVNDEDGSSNDDSSENEVDESDRTKNSLKISGKVVDEIESGDDDSDDESDSDENSSSDNEDDLGDTGHTGAVNSGKASSEKAESESLNNQPSVIKGGRKLEGSNDDSDDGSSEEDDDDEDVSEAEDDNDQEDTADKPEDELEAVKKELANIPLEDLMKIKEKLGLKVFNKIMHGGKFEEKKNKVFKRENKNRPMELSSKRKVPRLRLGDVPKEKVRRDPRFDDLSGEYQDKHFTKNYSFLTDIKAKEKLLVQKKMMKTKDEDKKQEMARLLNRMTQQEQAEEMKRKRMELETQWKVKERQHIKDGKTPYFLKKSDKKKLELAEKFKELQKSGQIDKYMSKRLKKNAQKEKKKLPERHARFT